MQQNVLVGNGGKYIHRCESRNERRWGNFRIFFLLIRSVSSQHEWWIKTHIMGRFTSILYDWEMLTFPLPSSVRKPSVSDDTQRQWLLTQIHVISHWCFYSSMYFGCYSFRLLSHTHSLNFTIFTSGSIIWS